MLFIFLCWDTYSSAGITMAAIIVVCVYSSSAYSCFLRTGYYNRRLDQKGWGREMSRPNRAGRTLQESFHFDTRRTRSQIKRIIKKRKQCDSEGSLSMLSLFFSIYLVYSTLGFRGLHRKIRTNFRLMGSLISFHHDVSHQGCSE